jgi:hypothetical protein
MYVSTGVMMCHMYNTLIISGRYSKTSRRSREAIFANESTFFSENAESTNPAWPQFGKGHNLELQSGYSIYKHLDYQCL